ncbi:MAG: ABC transporter ATP-binding protein [Aureliella sp.]
MIDQPKSILKVEDARLAYAHVQALAGLSLDLREGELMGLLGPNGAGKSSLVRCIGGRQPLSSGRIHFDEGRDAIGIVPQEIALYQDLTVTQNLKAFGRLHGVRGLQLRDQIKAAIEWSGLYEKRRSKVAALSGGMQRRLNIACSVLHRPSLLLLDEPTVGVDPQSRERIYEMLEELLDGGTSILLTTHHLDEAQHRCDRIAIIDKGQIVDCGTFEDLVDRTVGDRQQVFVRFSQPAREVPAPLQLGDGGFEAWGTIGDVTRELPRLLGRINMQKAQVDSVSLVKPTLHSVFLHLTGRELRE